jgi:hypothetical protein
LNESKACQVENFDFAHDGKYGLASVSSSSIEQNLALIPKKWRLAALRLNTFFAGSGIL